MTDLTETLETKTETPEPVKAFRPKSEHEDFNEYVTAFRVKHDTSEKLANSFLTTWFKVRLLEEVESKTITPEQIAEMHEKPIEAIYLFLYGNNSYFYIRYASICNHLNVSLKEFLEIDFL